MTAMVSRRRKQARSHLPPTHRTNPLLPYERRFARFLRQMNGIDFEIEPDDFEISPRRGQSEPQRPRPDFKVTRRHDGRVVYIELTQADLFTTEDQLPFAVRDRNVRSSHSGKPHISPEEYMILKRARMDEAATTYGVIIVVLDHADQLAMMADPSLLFLLFNRHLHLVR